MRWMCRRLPLGLFQLVLGVTLTQSYKGNVKLNFFFPFLPHELHSIKCITFLFSNSFSICIINVTKTQTFNLSLPGYSLLEMSVISLSV